MKCAKSSHPFTAPRLVVCGASSYTSTPCFSLLMSAYKCIGSNCGQTFATPRGLSGHMVRCPKYLQGVKHRLAEYTNTNISNRESSMQLPLTQTSVAGSAGGMTPTEEATHSGVPATEQVVAVRVHDLPVFTCLTQYSVRDNTLT